jgi:uncharacterized HAD superfamily protein
MDEVLADHTGSFNAFHDKKYGTNLVEMDINEFYLNKLIGITLEEELRRIEEFYTTDDFLNMKTVAGAVEGVKELAKAHELYVITSRPDFVEKQSRDWLDRYFPGRFKEFIILNHHFGGKDVQKKSDICRERKIDLMIDDLADYANDCAEVCKKVLLMERPWNEGKEIAPNVVRVKDWKEILNLLSQI